MLTTDSPMNDSNLTTEMQNYFDRVTEEIKAAVSETAAAIAAGAKQHAPYKIKGSIGAEVSKSMLSASVAVRSRHAASAEYGFAHNPDSYWDERKGLHRQGKLPEHITGEPIHAHTSKRKRADSGKTIHKPFLNPAYEEQIPLLLNKLQSILTT